MLPATAAVIGLVVLAQVPGARELVGVGLVAAGVALHREPASAAAGDRAQRPAAADDEPPVARGGPLLEDRLPA